MTANVTRRAFKAGLILWPGLPLLCMSACVAGGGELAPERAQAGAIAAARAAEVAATREQVDEDETARPTESCGVIAVDCQNDDDSSSP